MPSLYAQYIEEREGKHILESEYGFATYQFLDNGRCYIEDIYVVPDYRKSYAASNMANAITAIAKDKGCKTLIGSVVPSAKGSTASLKVLLAYGFKLESCQNNFIVMSKEI